MRNPLLAIGSVAALAAAAPALADGLSYNYIEGAYAMAEIEDLDADGFGVNGAVELTPNLHAFGSLRNLDFDDIDAELDTLTAGLGVNWPLAENVDVIGGASFERQKIEGTSESGWGIGAGVRGRVMNNLELTGAVKYADVGDFGNSTTFTAGGRWYFTPNFAVGVDYNRIDLGDDVDVDGDAWLLSLRYDFGDRM